MCYAHTSVHISGLGHVTGKNLWQTIPNILRIIWATDFKFGQ